MNLMSSFKTPATPPTPAKAGLPGLPVLAAVALAATALLPTPASAYPNIFGVGVTDNPTEFSQIVSPNTQQDFSTFTPGDQANPLSLGSGTYTAEVSATGGIKVIAPGSLTTNDAGATLTYTATGGNPTGLGGSLRLVNASGTTTSGKAIVTSFVTYLNGTLIGPVGPVTFDFDAVTGFDLTPYGLGNSFFMGVFLTPEVYALDPTAYYSSLTIQPDPTSSPTLYAAFDTVGFGASTVFTAVPELDAGSGSGALILLGGVLALLRERRGVCRGGARSPAA